MLRRSQQRRVRGMVHQIVYHRLRRQRLYEIQRLELRRTLHAQRCGVQQQPMLCGGTGQLLPRDNSSAAPGSQRRCLFRCPGAHRHPTARLRQCQRRRLGGSPGSQHQRRPPRRRKAPQPQALHHPRPVGVVPHGPTIPEAYGVHGSAGGCPRLHRIQQRQNTLLQGHGNVAPVPRSPAALRHKVLQCLRRHRHCFIASGNAALLHKLPVDAGRQAVTHRIPDDAQPHHRPSASSTSASR